MIELVEVSKTYKGGVQALRRTIDLPSGSSVPKLCEGPATVRPNTCGFPVQLPDQSDYPHSQISSPPCHAGLVKPQPGSTDA